MGERIDIMLDEEEVNEKIKELGKKISHDYAGKEVYMVCILKGASFFACELAKRITVPVYLDFMSVSSYGNEAKSSGNTLSYLVDTLRQRNPESIALCTLLDKPDRRVTDISVDYTGFQIPDEFVVGYGLDYGQKYRNLPYIGIVHID